MGLDEFNTKGITPALAWLGQQANVRATDTPAVRLQMLTTALQESALTYRRQLGNGPAKSFYQMERGGMVYSLLFNRDRNVFNATRDACVWRGVAADPMAVWNAIEFDDVLASVLARLGYLCDPQPIPAIGDADAAWQCYLAAWRPGKPIPGKWPDLYQQARQYLGV